MVSWSFVFRIAETVCNRKMMETILFFIASGLGSPQHTTPNLSIHVVGIYTCRNWDSTPLISPSAPSATFRLLLLYFQPKLNTISNESGRILGIARQSQTRWSVSRDYFHRIRLLQPDDLSSAKKSICANKGFVSSVDLPRKFVLAYDRIFSQTVYPSTSVFRR